jgi:hypothetical protein
MKSEHDSLVYINSDKDKEMVNAREQVIAKKRRSSVKGPSIRIRCAI